MWGWSYMRTGVVWGWSYMRTGVVWGLELYEDWSYMTTRVKCGKGRTADCTGSLGNRPNDKHDGAGHEASDYLTRRFGKDQGTKL